MAIVFIAGQPINEFGRPPFRRRQPRQQPAYRDHGRHHSFLTAACLLVVIASLPASSGMERAIPLGYTFLTMVGGKH
ncbi:MAG: hypothetical protein JSS04_26735 [Proteobacteria bacterium]|nr:hypothetical protein [Pseudomonadota bacterium]